MLGTYSGSRIKTSLHLPDLSCCLERISAASWRIFLRGRLGESHGEKGQLFPSTLVLCGLEQAQMRDWGYSVSV